MQTLLNLVRTTFAFLVLITIVVAVHEFAHLLTALAFGATVDAFSIGFGAELFGFDAGGIHWQVSAIPLGGYVSFPVEAGAGIVMVDSLSTAAQMTIMLSGVAILVGVAALLLRGGPNYGIDFLGGTMVQVRFQSPKPIGLVREAIGKLRVGEVVVQEFGDPREVLIRVE